MLEKMHFKSLNIHHTVSIVTDQKNRKFIVSEIEVLPTKDWTKKASFSHFKTANRLRG